MENGKWKITSNSGLFLLVLINVFSFYIIPQRKHTLFTFASIFADWMKEGEWKVKSEKWKVESGKWKVESGKWKMEDWESDKIKYEMRNFESNDFPGILVFFI